LDDNEMKIHRLRVERCGGWNDLTLPLTADGLTVLYGPNEAGKSTLMRFIRGVLFGFDPQDEAGPGARPRRLGCAGELIVSEGDEEYTLRRESEYEGRTGLRVTTRGAVLDAADAIERLRGGVSRDIFERVFALGLAELQQLAALHDDEVARKIYEMSLGRDGQRVAAAWESSEAARQELWDTQTRTGTLIRLASALEEVEMRLADGAAADQQYLETRREQVRLTAEIENQRTRQRGLQEQLRGHDFMERIWGPWRRARALGEEQASLRFVEALPQDGPERLDELELQAADLQRRRDRIREDVRRIRETVRNARRIDPLGPHGAALRRLAGRSDAISQIESRLDEKQEQVAVERGKLDESLRQLGTGWDESRLDRLDARPAATHELFRRARQFRATLISRGRRIRRYQQWSAELQRRGECLTALRKVEGRPAEEVREVLGQRITALEQIERLQLQVSVRTDAVNVLQDQLRIAETPRTLPACYYSVLALFGLGGAALVAVGTYRVIEGVASAGQWMVGVIFALLGICAAGLTWTMKRQFDPSDDSARSLRNRLAVAEDELGDARRDLAGLLRELRTRPPLRTSGDANFHEPLDIKEQLNTARDELMQLDRELRDNVLYQRRREQMAQIRADIRKLQRTVSAARGEWCQALKMVGLDESLQIEGSLRIWETAQEAKLRLQTWRAVRDELESDRASVRSFHDDVAELTLALEEPRASDPHARVAAWNERWKELQKSRQRTRAARRELRAHRREWREVARETRTVRERRTALLQSIGVANREEFLGCYREQQRLFEVQRQLEVAREELAAAAQTEPQLAVVEEDLLDFDPACNRQAIETLRRELSDLEHDLQESHHRLGQVKQEMQAREADRTAVELRFERAQLQDQWERALATWSSVALARQGLDSLRTRLERTCQPETLTRASGYLRALTGGRYERVWTPLGERRLVLDDQLHEAWRVEQLSSGTREQLFLAIRLALIDQFREQRVELPVVLDDVLVNFDQLRTEAAIDTLVEYARGGRQVLMFTCHLHLAAMCEETGVRTLRLPEAATGHARRRVG
jgi:uncharacterized protein YhaN